MTASDKPKRWPWKVFHVPKGIAYAVGNSRFGSWIARKLGFNWIDKDILVTKDGVPVFAHWPLIVLNGFLLPKWFTKKYGKRPRINEVLWEDLAKLSTPTISYRGYRRKLRFNRADLAIIYNHSIKLKTMIEQKGSTRYRNKAFWVEFGKRVVNVPKNERVVATLPTMAGAFEVLKAAHEADWLTMVIRANEGVPRSWEPYMTYYRGKIKWIEGK